MKLFYITSLLWFSVVLKTIGQNIRLDSIRLLLSKTSQDTSRVLRLEELADYYKFINSDSCKLYAEQALQLAEQLDFAKGKGRALSTLSVVVREQANMPQALEMLFKALAYNRATHDQDGEGVTQIRIGTIYVDLGDNAQALDAYKKALALFSPTTPTNLLNTLNVLSNVGEVYRIINQLDSAALFYQKAHELGKHLAPRYSMRSVLNLGIIQAQLGNKTQALNYYRQVLREGFTADNFRFQGIAHYHLADLFHSINQIDSSLHYAHLARKNFQKAAFKRLEVTLYQLLTRLYQAKNNADSALHYQSIGMALKDSLYGPERFQKLQLLRLAEQQRQQEILESQREYQSRVRFFALLAGLSILLLLTLILYRNNRQKHRANQLLNEQKAKVELTLNTLRSTQAQLIQKEKMASLGELTAGIAHEIQNPLNFVNNFSEVSEELMEEMQEELQKGEIEEAKAIAADIRQNLQKINHHGKRAGSIVSGMLEHSRTGTGERQSTDLNALADEYLRLAFQGLRAKNKEFNCELSTDFDPSLSVIEVVPQEIGRVLLNLYNNAFYTVREKQKTASDTYQPTITVSTKQTDKQIEIRVRDNGTGIPVTIKDKIFQPFFTTKPTGEGTGLSLSYDIITKGHGGVLRVESAEGEFTEFIIQLPIKTY